MTYDTKHPEEHEGTRSYVDYTHPMRTTVSKLPWHTDDKPFGMTQEEYEDLIEEAVTNVEPTETTDCELP
jgi:hypothetical protein